MPVIIQPSPGGGSVVITDSSGAVWGNIEGTMAARNFAASNGRFVSDTYSDGLRSPQNATSNNGPSPVLWVRAV